MMLTIFNFNPTALRMSKPQWRFGHSECNRVKLASSISFLLDSTELTLLDRWITVYMQTASSEATLHICNPPRAISLCTYTMYQLSFENGSSSERKVWSQVVAQHVY